MSLSEEAKATIYFTEFHWDKENPEYSHLQSYIEISLQPSLGGTLIRSLEESDWISDWRSIAQYFENHILTLKQNWQAESIDYRPRSHQFRIKGLMADEPEQPTHFTLQFMVNVKQNPPRPQRIYAGVHLMVLISDVEEFVTSLNDFLSKLENSSGNALE